MHKQIYLDIAKKGRQYYGMTAYQKLLDHYGSARAIREKYGVTRETVRLWKVRGLPSKLALQFESDTGGALTIREVLESKQVSA